mgnify:CR=1 FL=1
MKTGYGLRVGGGWREAMEPIDVVLFCPNCKTQHVDRPEPQVCVCGHRLSGHELEPDCTMCTHCVCGEFCVAWDNPPHKSHLCKPEDGGCGTIFRPSDVPTNGIETPTTEGENDTWKWSEK